MDPEAIADLQRLYAKKHKSDSGISSKRRRIEPRAVKIDGGSKESSPGPDLPDVESASVASEDSFAEFEDEGDLPLSSRTSDEVVEVISFDEGLINVPRVGAVQGYKSFMSGKVPKPGAANVKKVALHPEEGEAPSDSEDDLKKDKELQKLLRESHLLHEQGGDSLETTGKIRQKAIKNQLILNGASKEKQRKMPIGMRKGIEAAATRREGAADKYNKDNGIITARKVVPIVKKKNNKTLHELNVGKYKNGKLTISRREIDRINGPKTSSKGKKKRGFRDFSNIG